MLTQIAFFNILGLPLTYWGGIVALLLMILSGLIAYLNSKGVNKPPLITLAGHKITARLGLLIALIHGLLALIVRLF